MKHRHARLTHEHRTGLTGTPATVQTDMCVSVRVGSRQHAHRATETAIKAVTVTMVGHCLKNHLVNWLNTGGKQNDRRE
jgi:hypothetical protein